MSDIIINAAPAEEATAAEKRDARGRFRQDKFSTLHLPCFLPAEKTPPKL